jgi:hypothetical protein
MHMNMAGERALRCTGGGTWQPIGRVEGNTGLWRGLVTGSAPFSVKIEDTNNLVSSDLWHLASVSHALRSLSAASLALTPKQEGL